ncbi:MAG: amidohydrolase [Candidatus Rokubacteria bacterium]|nr:amidohydrolase [Candidatus Rokubacteria bacterium]
MAGSTAYLNGTVLTMVPGAPPARALAVQDGRIVAVGGEEAVRRFGGGEHRVVDLAGRAVLPGFVDPHNHFAVGALEAFWADCRTPPLGTIAEVQAALRAAAAAAPAGEWVRGVGYHHAHLAERRHPTRAELDEAVPERPAFLVHFSHHQGVANSRALATAGITRATCDPPGGEIGRDRDGEPTGLLFERAMASVERASREGWEGRFVEVASAASRRFAALGLTTVQDAAVGPALERRYAAADAAGRLAIRVARMVVAPSGWFDPPWAEARTRGAGRTLKVFVDGGYRCAMRLPRDGREVASGFLFYRQAELAELLVTAWRNGWRVTCHAIGNLGVETCVGAVEDALARERRGAGRVRLDHAMFLTSALISRIRALGLPVVTQPSFLYDQGPPAFTLPADLRCRPFGSLRAAGIPQAFSSDYPCGTAAPLVGVYAAVARRARDGRPADPEEAVPVEAALAAYTREAARACGIEAECGTLEVGKRADLVILDRNPLEVPAEAVLGLRVTGTVVGGREVWP